MRCMAYIDLNMVRAGAVAHPSEWPESGYREIQRLPSRYRIIDTAELCGLFECRTPQALRRRVSGWTERTLEAGSAARESAWTESLAVGGRAYLAEVKRALGPRAARRGLVEEDEGGCHACGSRRRRAIPSENVTDSE
jgi:putative transposase